MDKHERKEKKYIYIYTEGFVSFFLNSHFSLDRKYDSEPGENKNILVYLNLNKLTYCLLAYGIDCTLSIIKVKIKPVMQISITVIMQKSNTNYVLH
jgi:hypothetical protein